jgi:hypothetical protein
MGGGNPVLRALAGAATLGGSELAQKKPFQDPLKDRPTSGMSGSLLRFLPGASAATGAVDLGAQMQAEADKQGLAPATAPRAPQLDDAAAAAEAANDAERRRRASIGKASTILTSFEPSVTGTARRYLGGG